MSKSQKIHPLPLGISVILFGIPTILLLIATRIVIPRLNEKPGMLPVISWFLAGGILVFLPLFAAALIACRMEGGSWNWRALSTRLRLQHMRKKDWGWTAIGVAGSFAGMGLMMATANGLAAITGWYEPLSTNTPFLDFHGLEPGQSWVLLIWLLFFFFNICGEELWWRGYILPRQELRHGNSAWIINGSLWSLFHVAFGWNLLILMIPVLFLQPYIVQRRKNTWVGIWMHGIFNGPIFVAICLNWI